MGEEPRRRAAGGLAQGQRGGVGGTGPFVQLQMPGYVRSTADQYAPGLRDPLSLQGSRGREFRARDYGHKR